MKTFVFALILASSSLAASAMDNPSFTTSKAVTSITKTPADSLKLQVDGVHCYYQNTVKVDSIPESLIYGRTLQFMASKNITQTYGYEEEGKLIFTTTQDLNINPVNIGDDNDIVEPYTTQFAITIDMKNGRYRCTINNVLFYIPSPTGNKRETLYDVYLKATNTDSRRVAKNAKKLIESFERYITSLTDDLRESIEQKSAIHHSNF